MITVIYANNWSEICGNNSSTTKEKPMAMKPQASDYTDLKKYIQDKKAYAVQMGKNPNKIALHYYKEQGIYSIQDLLDHREQNPWSRVDL